MVREMGEVREVGHVVTMLSEWKGGSENRTGGWEDE